MKLRQEHTSGLRQRNRVTEEKGFTLVEIMITIVILSLGLLATASMQMHAVSGNASANRLTEATNLGQDKLEALMALPYTQAFTDENLTDDAVMAVATGEPFTDDNPTNLSFDDGFEAFTDWNGNGIRDSVFGPSIEEVYVDANGNGLWDIGESFTDANGNDIWDAAHVDPTPPAGYTITWSVIDNNPVNLAKLIRVFVTRRGEIRPTQLSCIKPRQQ